MQLLLSMQNIPEAQIQVALIKGNLPQNTYSPRPVIFKAQHQFFLTTDKAYWHREAP